MAALTESEAVSGARSTNQTPPGRADLASAAALRASRVFPVPPGPAKRNQAGGSEELANLRQFPGAAHERGDLAGQVAGDSVADR